jgi:hypothetical protein
MRRDAIAVAGGLCVLLSGGWAVPASAQVPAPPGAPSAAAVPAAPSQAEVLQDRVDRAAQQMETDPQAAIEALDHMAVESAELRKTHALTAAERPAHRQIYILRARAHLLAMDNDKVDDSYRELLHIDPFFTATLAPREQALLDGLRTRESGLIEVTSGVRDCRVLADGVELGVTGDAPVRASLMAGSYEVRLEKPGYRAAASRVTIVAAQTVAVADLNPKPQVPPVAFLVDRIGVNVSVDNVAAGSAMRLDDLKRQLSAEEATALEKAATQSRFDPATSAGFVLREPPVDHSIVLRFSGACLVEESRTVSVTAEALAAIDASAPLLWYGDTGAVRMRPDVGTLRVTSNPTDADIYIDGALAGRSPFERNVCTGERRVRVRHRIGSYTTTARIARGRTEVIDVTLKPGLAFLGAVESVQGALRSSQDLTTAIDRVLASVVKSFRLSSMVELPPETQRWTDSATAELLTAAEAGDADRMKGLLRVASENYDAPLLLGAVAPGGSGAGDPPVDLLLFWYDHAAVDRVRVAGVKGDALAATLQRLDRPSDSSQLVYQNDIGLRVVDTQLDGAPLLVASVDPGGPAATAGVRIGDAVVSVDGAQVSAAQLGELIGRKKPGEIVSLSIADSAPSRPLAVPVQRRPRRAAAFEPAVFGNGMFARLQAGAAMAATAQDRDLLGFSTALVLMRFRLWRPALDLLSSLGPIPTGLGVGPGAVSYYRARCHLEIGERDRALALLREVSMADTQILADDGATVGTLARLRLSQLGQ